MGDIWRPSDSGSRYPYPGAFIHCVGNREPMIHKLWCHGIDTLCCKVHHAARIEIPAVTNVEFFTKNLSANGRRNRIIGELSINGIIQFIRLSEIWGSGLPYIANYRAPEITGGWSSTGSTNYTGILSRSYTISLGTGLVP